MKFLPPALNKTLYVAFMGLCVTVLWAMLSELLVSAIAPSKPPFFWAVFAGLAGLILLCIYLAIHRIFLYAKPLPVWISALGVALVLIAAFGAFGNMVAAF